MNDKIKFRKLLFSDTIQMENWKEHEDPFFYHYNFICKTEEERKNWYKSKNIFLIKNIFGMFVEGILIGFITIKKYDVFKRQAEMGISMDLNYVNKGYGTRFIKLYLEYVFKNTIFKKIVLRTAIFNKRAIKTYEKVGFELIRTMKVPYEEQIYNEAIIEKYDNLDIRGGIIYVEYCFMEILKANFTNNEF